LFREPEQPHQSAGSATGCPAQMRRTAVTISDRGALLSRTPAAPPLRPVRDRDARRLRSKSDLNERPGPRRSRSNRCPGRQAGLVQ
jgi:hypothetical protein